MYQKTVLPNGVRVVTATMPHTYSVSVSIFLGVGSRYEPEAQSGISHFIEHMCFKGTTKRPTSQDISEAIEGVGGILNGGTDKEFTLYWCKVTRPHFRLALDVLTDMFRHSTFDAAELEKERQVIIEEIHRCKDSPSQLVGLFLDELLWPGHPLGRDVAGKEDSVSAVDRATMLSYVSDHYLPNNTVVAIAGNVTHEESVLTVSQVMGSWAEQRRCPEYVPFQERANSRLHIEPKDTEQAHLCLALPGLSILHPKRFVLDLMNVILGEGMSSRLFVEIRDRLGLAYNIGSYIDHLLDTGSLTVCAGVDPQKLAVAVEAIVQQLHRLQEHIPEAELLKAKEQSKGRLLLGMEDSRNVANWLGGQEILTGRILTVDDVTAIIDAITADQITRLAEEMVVNSKLRLAVVGPVTEEGALRDLLA
ncbi:MAG: insulinase family protein [Chloroflexi bacterium]|nr:insulinase family protein [Chloroflexota bacterium]